MSTLIYTQRADTRWQGLQARNGNSLVAANGVMTWAPPPLRPGRPHNIKIRIWATGQASRAFPVNVIIQGRPFSVPSTRWTEVEAPVDTNRPVTVQITAVNSCDVIVTVTTPDEVPLDPVPADVLAMDAWLPVPTAAMRWDISRWDRASWNTPTTPESSLVWDQGRWDQKTWHDPKLSEAWETWTPILGPCTRVAATRGVDSTGPVLQAQAGSLAITATDDLNPRALGMAWGTPIRLYHWPTATLIWTGWITDLATTPAKTGKGSTTITASDAVARLVAVTRYGARPEGGGNEPWAARLTRLMSSLPEGMTYRARSSSSEPMCPTVWETDLASHLDALVASTGGAWASTRDGDIEVWATLPNEAPALTLTDTHDLPSDGTKRIAYTAGPSTWTAASVIAGIEVTTHNAAPDDSGEWRANDETITVIDPTIKASWGGMSVRVDMLTPTPEATTQAAMRLLRRASDAPLLEKATYWPASTRSKPGTKAGEMTYASSLDPLTPVVGIAAGERATSLIARVVHDITPTTWKTELDLTTRDEERTRA